MQTRSYYLLFFCILFYAISGMRREITTITVLPWEIPNFNETSRSAEQLISQKVPENIVNELIAPTNSLLKNYQLIVLFDEQRYTDIGLLPARYAMIKKRVGETIYRIIIEKNHDTKTELTEEIDREKIWEIPEKYVKKLQK